MEAEAEFAGESVNLGIFDGEVNHAEINRAITAADKVILLGEQTRLPYFPDDVRLRKFHAGDPLVLFLWKVLKKIPSNLRDALIDEPISLTLIHSDELLYFRDYRCHQALHIGRRRHTIYLPEVLIYAAEEKGYDHWAIAEGLIYAGWMLLDYLLLTNVLKSYQGIARKTPRYRLGEVLLLKLVEQHNSHRRDSVDEGRSEVREFVEGYKDELIRIDGAEAAESDPVELAHLFFATTIEQKWARDKMERIARIFNFPRMFLFDRDIIHGAARELAKRQNQDITPRSFGDLLHDYHDDLRFERDPLMTTFGKGVVPKPRAVFLQRVVQLGAKGLRGFFSAYRNAEPEVVELMHPLWMYLCSLSSDPAGIFSRVGRCRGLGRLGEEDGMAGPLAGILIRLDRADNYGDMVAEVGEMGLEVRAELTGLIDRQQLVEEDEWEVFKSRKQTIVTRAVEVLERIQGDGLNGGEAGPRRSPLHQDKLVGQLLQDSPHRQTSDPSGVLLYLRSYQRSLKEFGPDDPDTDFLLACLLIRLDRSEHYSYLLERIQGLGILAFSALHNVFENIPEHDLDRHGILKPARILWTRMLEQMRKQNRKDSSA
jgi:hypothetical protein